MIIMEGVGLLMPQGNKVRESKLKSANARPCNNKKTGNKIANRIEINISRGNVRCFVDLK